MAGWFGARTAAAPDATFPVERSETEWKATLSPEQYHVLRQHGTEQPGSSKLNFEKRTGLFSCAGCGQALFTSDTKYESGSGWPSFFQPGPPRPASATA